MSNYHLIYNFDYDKEIPQNIYIKCVNDIKQKYTYYENNNTEYNKVVSNMKEVKVAPIIAGMEPTKARDLSIELAKQNPLE